MSVAEFLEACEMHDAQRLTDMVAAGFEVHARLDGKLPIAWLLEMYTRSDALPFCLRALVKGGAWFEDPDIAPVLLNDTFAIQQAAHADAEWLYRRTTLHSAFTPLEGATPLHVAAEYGYVEAARTLIALGADVNARADVDRDGLGGHTPLFHTVNSHANRSVDVMRLLIASGAAVEARVAGLTWGRGFEWETTLFDLTPIAYAQCGLLPQMHRDAIHVVENVRELLAAGGRPVPSMPNVPNRYVTRSQR